MRRLLRALRRRRGGAGDRPPLPDDELPIRDVVDDPAWFRMGVGSYGRPRVWAFRGDVGGVTVGSYTSIGPDVSFLVGGNHRIDWVTTWPVRELCGLPGAYEDGNPWSRGPITVGSDVWIGMGATVLSGVTIGDGAVVAAAAVVTRDVRPFAVVAGNPAVETHRRFDDATVDRLLAARWWEWPLARVRAEADLLCQADVARFLDAVEGGADPG